MPAWQGSIDDTVAFLVREGKDPDQAVAIARDLARERGAGVEKRVSLEIRKVTDPGNGDKPLTAVAWASVITKADGTPITDHDGHVILFEDLEKAFADFALTGGVGRGGEMHKAIGGADIIGQITLSRDERIALGFGPGPEGAVVKVRVLDPVLKQRVRSGELAELSIAGSATALPLEAA